MNKKVIFAGSVLIGIIGGVVLYARRQKTLSLNTDFNIFVDEVLEESEGEEKINDKDYILINEISEMDDVKNVEEVDDNITVEIKNQEDLEEEILVFSENSTDLSSKLDKKEKNKEEIEYVTFEDFLDDSNGYLKRTWTFFEPDQILINHKEEIVTKPELVLGEEKFGALKFGLNSNDKDIVYILNKNLKAIIEFIRDERSYKEVFGENFGNKKIGESEFKNVQKYRNKELEFYNKTKG